MISDDNSGFEQHVAREDHSHGGWLVLQPNAGCSGTVTLSQIGSATITGQTIYSGAISASHVMTGTLGFPDVCLVHTGGEWHEADGMLTTNCVSCGQVMIVDAPDSRMWGRSLAQLLARVVAGDIDDDIRARVNAEREVLALATERMDLLTLLLP